MSITSVANKFECQPLDSMTFVREPVHTQTKWKNSLVYIVGAVMVGLCLAAMFFFCFHFNHRAKDECYAHAEIGSMDERWKWNMENCSTLYNIGNGTQVKVKQRGLYMIQVQITCGVGLPEESKDNGNNYIELKVSPNRERDIVKNLYLPHVTNETQQSSYSLETIYLLSKGDVMELNLNINRPLIFNRKESTFWRIHKIDI
ncbi:uncharacterized protein LOC134568705 [Pelobates fuscus]|uniref:uncharacterized protein LOC134568705 n=1 Tax=Pelobates fuscus TaxID=191477 RepID=UPI002FE4E33E